MFIPDLIEVFGQAHPRVSLDAIETITQFTSAEFAIRPFLLNAPDSTMKQMLKWSTHQNDQVRRLSSEGCRPRLPWAMALPFLKKDPSPVLPILENLKADRAETVRRSVANNLNDISKDHPDLVAQIARQWSGKSAETNWIIKHGCRTLLKRAHGKTLDHFGLKADVHVSVTGLKLAKKKIRIGESLTFSFNVSCREKKATNLRLEYAIDYRKASGKASQKIFQIRELGMAPGETLHFIRKQSFRDFTTRTHFPGEHKIYVRVNGQPLASASFFLTR
jgi:3-methyladenine DNA glycosylase AlkC